MLGGHIIKTWSKTQVNIALSSAEIEFYGTLKTAQESMGLISLAKEFDTALKARLLVDASAALGVAQRLGVGRIRHLETGALWLQEQELRKVLRLAKVAGSLNNADVMTKNDSREILERFIGNINGTFAEGRAGKAVNLHLLDKKIRQLNAEVRALQSLEQQGSNFGDDIDNSNDDEFIANIDERVLHIEQNVMKVIEDSWLGWKQRQCKQRGLTEKHMGC